MQQHRYAFQSNKENSLSDFSAIRDERLSSAADGNAFSSRTLLVHLVLRSYIDYTIAIQLIDRAQYLGRIHTSNG